MEFAILFTLLSISISIMIAIAACKLSGSAAENQPRTPLHPGSLNHGLRPFLITIGGFLLGTNSRLLRYLIPLDLHLETIGAVALMLGVVLLLLVQHQKQGTNLAFQLENMALWLGFIAGWTILHGSLWEDFISAAFLYCIGSWAVGSLFLLLKTLKPKWPRNPSPVSAEA